MTIAQAASDDRGRVMVQTVTGPIAIEALGRTLMHEHLLVAAPGWEFDCVDPGPSFADMVARCVDRIEELKSAGYRSLVDPCPMDMGRDVELMREVAIRTGFNIICATGLYHGEIGAAGHWRHTMMYDPDCHRRLADVLISELTRGVGNSGILPGILKVATGRTVTAYEQMTLRATAIAAQATDTPITTHTEGMQGDVQLDELCGMGTSAERIVIGHCCGSKDRNYLRALAARGAYLGFDRFGFEAANSDEQRVEALCELIRAGYGERIVVSHDCVLCYRGSVDRLAPRRAASLLDFERRIVPMLRERGLADDAIDRLTAANPRAFFAGASVANPNRDLHVLHSARAEA
jgi:phosphotriesterase-related protein